MAKSRARKLADIIVGAGIDIDGNLTFDGGSTSADLTFADNDKANFGDASDLQIYHDGSASYIKEAGTGDFIIQGSNTLRLQGSSSQELANFGTGGAVTLFYNNSAKLATFSGGVSVTGQLNATTMHLPDGSTGLQLGASNDTKFFHDGSNSKITHSGSGGFYIGADTLGLQTGAHNENYLTAAANGAVSLYYDNSAKLATATGGITVTGETNTTSLASGNSTMTGLVQIGNSSGGTLLFKRPSANYIFADQTGGYLVFGTNGRSTSIANSNFYLGADQSTTFVGGANFDDSISSDGPITINGSGTEDRYLKFALDGRGSAFTGENAAFIFCGQGGSGDFLAGGLYLQSRSATAGREIGFITGTTPAKRMVIDSSGNVGIDPSSGYTLTDKLTVRGSQSQLRIQDSSVDAKGVSLLYSNSNNYGQLICDHRGNNQLNFYYSALNHYFGRNTSSSYIYMTLTDTGELGLGTTSPFAKSHIVDTGWSSGAPYGTVQLIEGNNVNDNNWGHLVVTDTTTTSGNGGAISFATGTSSALNPFAGIKGVSEGTSYGGLGLFTRANGGIATERMRITSTGKVGIGETSPDTPLEVKSSGTGESTGIRLTDTNGTVRGNLYFGGAQNFVIHGASAPAGADAPALQFATGGSTPAVRMTVLEEGNVGIGTTAPVSLLHIKGSGTYNHTPANPQGADFVVTSSEMSDNNAHSIMQLVSVRQSLTTGSGSTGYLGFSTMDDSNNAGINDAARIAIVNEAGSSVTSATALSFWTNAGGSSTGAATERMRIDSSGNVGIGTSSPTSTLDLTNASDTAERAIRIENSSARVYIGVEGSSGNRFVSSSTNNAFIGTTTDDGLELATANVVRAIITNGGNVGIGVTNPDVKLEVSGSARFAQENHAWTFDDTNNNRLGFVKQSGSYSMLASAANTPIIFATSNNSNLQSSVSGQTLYERMRVNYNGNVGIGETSPDYTLHVNSGTVNVAAKFESTDSTSVIQFVDPNGNCEFGTTGSVGRISPNGSYAVLEASQTAVVINNAAQDCDFRVESSGNANMFKVDAGDNQVLIATSSSFEPSNYGLYARNGLIVGNFSGTGAGFTVRRGDSLKFNINHDSTKGFVTTGGNPLHFRTSEDANYKISMETSGVVINENGQDYDFRVEGVGEANALFVQGSNGNVGIGTSSPANRLEVKASGNDNGIMLKSTTNADLIWLHQQTTSEGVLRIYGSGGAKVIIPGHNSPTYFNNGNNFGIGTTSPSAKLHVAGAIKGTDLIAHDSTGLALQTDEGTKRLVILDSGGVVVGGTSADSSSSMGGQNPVLFADGYTSLGGLRIKGTDTGNTLYKTGGAFGLTLGDSNMITLSNSNSTARLSAGNWEVLSGGQLRAYRGGNSAYGALYMDTGENLFIYNSWGAKSIVLDRDGNVGIGTTNPNSKLEVNNPSGAGNGSAQEIARFVNTASGATSMYLYLGASSGVDWRIGKNVTGVSGNANFSIANHSGTRMLDLTGDGHLALGITDPSNPKHRKVEVTPTVAVTSTAWSTSTGNNGGYDVKSDDSSTYSNYGGVTVAGVYNRHVAEWELHGNMSANTWYPVATMDQLMTWQDQTGSSQNSGFSMYFRLYAYDVGAGGPTYLSSAMTERIWVNGYTSNSTQEHRIHVGPWMGHAPNHSPTLYSTSQHYQLRIHHHLNTETYYAAQPVLEILVTSARTGLDGTGSKVLNIYGYVG